MLRKASAVWQGNLKGGKGTISTASGVLSNAQYSFSTRFEEGIGTNPEELIAAAHASCFSMALSAQLGEAGLTPDRIDTTCTVTMEKNAVGWEISEPSRCPCESPRRKPGCFRDGGQQRQGGLPDIATAEHEDHDDGVAGEVKTFAFCLLTFAF